MQLLSGSKTTTEKGEVMGKVIGFSVEGLHGKEKCDHGDVESKETFDGLIVGMVLWAAMGQT
jgi:hypothetical protein